VGTPARSDGFSASENLSTQSIAPPKIAAAWGRRATRAELPPDVPACLDTKCRGLMLGSLSLSRLHKWLIPRYCLITTVAEPGLSTPTTSSAKHTRQIK